MKFDDLLLGGLMMAFAAVVVGHAQSFPILGGMAYGPGLFPSVIGSGIGLAGLILAVGGLMRRRREAGPWVFLSDAWRERRTLQRVAVILGSLIFYVLASEILGFHLTGALIVALAMWSLGVTPVWILGFGLLVPLATHYVFYSLLRVPLPWGLLTPVAW